MEGRKGEEELRKMYAKTIYLGRKYRSLESLNSWLEEAKSVRDTEYSLLIEKAAGCWHDDPPDQKVSKLIDEATEHFSMERIFSKYWTSKGEIDTKLKEIEVEDDPLATIRLEIEDFKTVDRKLQIECELSPDRERLHFLLFLLEQDFCDLVDNYLHDAKAYRSARMEEIKRESELLCSVVPESRQRSTKEHVPCREFSQVYFTACSQLSGLVDDVDALIVATSRNILKLQEASRKVLLVKLLAHNLHHLLTPIVELRLDLCLSIGIFREDCESQLRSLNRSQSGEVMKTSLEDYFNLKAELTNKERRMVHHGVQTVRGLAGDKVGANEAEEYLILLTKEYDAKIDKVLYQVGLFEEVWLGDCLRSHFVK